MKAAGSAAPAPWRASWRAAALAAGLRLDDLRRITFAELIQIVHAGQVAAGGRRRWRHALQGETETLRARFEMLLSDAKQWPLDSISKSDSTPPKLNEDSPQSDAAPRASTSEWAALPDPP